MPQQGEKLHLLVLHCCSTSTTLIALLLCDHADCCVNHASGHCWRTDGTHLLCVQQQYVSHLQWCSVAASNESCDQFSVLFTVLCRCYIHQWLWVQLCSHTSCNVICKFFRSHASLTVHLQNSAALHTWAMQAIPHEQQKEAQTSVHATSQQLLCCWALSYQAFYEICCKQACNSFIVLSGLNRLVKLRGLDTSLPQVAAISLQSPRCLGCWPQLKTLSSHQSAWQS